MRIRKRISERRFLNYTRNRFLQYVSKEEDCWIWTGCLIKGRGYGKFTWEKGLTVTAHKASYQLFVGEVPDNVEIHHKCLNKLCVNPAHLEPLTRKEHERAHRQCQ